AAASGVPPGLGVALGRVASVFPLVYGANSRRMISARDAPRQLLSLSSLCVLAKDLMRLFSPVTKSARELLASCVWAIIALAVASTFLTRWSSSTFNVR